MWRFPTPDEFIEAARQVRLPMAKVCEIAGVHISIFNRWRAGAEPKMVSIQRIAGVLEAEIKRFGSP